MNTPIRWRAFKLAPTTRAALERRYRVPVHTHQKDTP